MPTGPCAGFTTLLTWETERNRYFLSSKGMNKNKNAGTEEVLYRLGFAAALVAAVLYILRAFCPPFLQEWWERYSFCVVYRFTGFTCPGCGGTRALRELFHGHIVASMLYHPLVPYGAVWYVAFMGSHTWAGIRSLADGRSHGSADKEEPERSVRGERRVFKGMSWRDGYVYGAVGILLANFVIKNLIRLVTGTDVMAWLDHIFGA